MKAIRIHGPMKVTLESGKIETRSLISHQMKLEDFEKGIDIMVNRKENACKVILNP